MPNVTGRITDPQFFEVVLPIFMGLLITMALIHLILYWINKREERRERGR